MILQAKQQDIIKTGEDTSKKATINQDKLAKLQYLLTKGLYSDPESAVIVEWTNNAVDAVVQSGKNPVEHPVIVKLTQNKFSVQDKGIGLNKEEFETVCMSYLSSTKEDDNSQIGAFGIGMKSFMSLDRSATFVCIKDKVEYKFLAYQGQEFMEYDLIYEKPTEEENGVTCEITINGWSEFSRFRDKAKQKLAYYDTVVLEIDGQIINNQIIRSEDWQYSNYADYSELHLCLKDVLYKLDWDKLGIPKIYVPIALRFDLNSKLTPTPSREALLYTSETIQLIKDKIGKVSSWFVERFNNDTPDERELLEAWDDISKTSKSVKIADEEFCIDGLLKYTNIQPKELKIKGISFREPKFYWDNRYKFLEEYITLVDYRDSSWRVKHVCSCDVMKLLSGVKFVQVNRVPTGKLKEFLINKHKGRVLFISKIHTRKLGNLKRPAETSYIRCANLTMILDDSRSKTDRSKWRNAIIEWQHVENQFKSLIIDETNCENSPEFLQYVAEQKEIAKLNRKKGIYSSNYKRINKTLGDITIQIAMERDKGIGVKFVKKAVKITELNKLHKNTHALHIYFPEEQKERASEFYNLLRAKFNICLLSPRELKRLPKIKNFMTETEFIQSRPFCKIMSSLKYEKALNTYDELYRRTDSVIENVLSKFKEQRDVLKDYVRQNGRNIPNNLLNELKEIAEIKGLYDHSLDSVYYEFLKNIQKYEFISCLSTPRKWDDEEVAKYNKLINSLLLLKSKYNNFEELDIIVKEKQLEVVAVIEEETILEEEIV